MTLDPNLRPPRGVRREVTNVEETPIVDPRVPPVVPGEAVEEENVVENVGGIERHGRVVRDDSGLEHREQVVRDVEGERRWSLYSLSQVIWFLLGIIEILIGLRVLLKIIDANPDNGFAHFIYNASAIFLAPFFGLTGSPSAGGAVLEIPSLIAMLVYAVLAWGIVQLIWLFYRPMTRGGSSYDRRRF